MLLIKGRCACKKNGAPKNKTVQKLKNMLQSNPSFTNQVMFYGSKVRATRAYWFQRGGELVDLVIQLRSPNVFFTLSAAGKLNDQNRSSACFLTSNLITDLHWPDFVQAVESTINVSALSPADAEKLRRKLLNKNPHIASRFFSERADYFISHDVVPKFKVVDHWYR